MPDEHMLARCVIDPHLPEDVFAPEAYFKWGGDKKELDGYYHCGVSVGDSHLLLSEDDIHSYGCRVSANQNRKKREKLEGKGELFEDEKHRTYYIGYYLLDARAVICISDVVYKLTVVSIEEDNEKAHSEIRMVQVSPATRREFLDKRLEAMVALGKLLFGPWRYICDCDESERARLQGIELPTFAAIVSDVHC